MIERVAAAFERQDYREAAQLLKQLLKTSPNNPSVQFYTGRLHEVTGKLEAAEKVYRQLLRDTTNPKMVTAARQGLQRVETIQKEQRKNAIAQAKANPGSTEIGVLILEPVPPEAKTAAAQNFARIMNIDPYTARLLLQSRGWRLYRTGAIGELQYFGQQLREANIPCFWVAMGEIQKINVFRVSYFHTAFPQPTVICSDESDRVGSLTFDWSEVSHRVEGLLPIFEEVVDLDYRKKLQRKVQTQDYAQFCDLHLPSRRSILRLYDSGYQFQNGIHLTPEPDKDTTRRNWNRLLEFLNHQLPNAKVWSDFTPFAETALDQTELLDRIKSHMHLFRRTESRWDPAFQLYSGLVFLKHLPVPGYG
jgi:tetratricopeptide (TPR) repeat protein